MSDLDLMFLKLVKAYGVAGSAMLFALTGFGCGVWLVSSAWMTVQGQAGINETKIRLYEAEIERVRLTEGEREAVEGVAGFLFGLSETGLKAGTCQVLIEHEATLRNLLARLS